MSAPTPAPGDDRPREGYYPDPSIPGYVRYWNGAAWVPGTSRPAPSDGESLNPPSGSGQAAAVEETGPHFFDEDPEPGRSSSSSSADTLHGNRPEPASAWGADRSRQTGFGGAKDRRVSWGAPTGQDPRVPRAADPGEDAGRSPGTDGRFGGTTSTDGTATIPPADEDDDSGAPQGTVVFRRPNTSGGSRTAEDAEPSQPEGTMTFRTPSPRAGQQSGGPGSPAYGAPRTSAQAAAQQALGLTPQESSTGPTTPTPPTAPSGPQSSPRQSPQPSARPSATAAPAPATAPAQRQPQSPPQTPSQPQPQPGGSYAQTPVQSAQPSPPVPPQASAPSSAPSTPSTPTPMTAGPGGGQPSWAQQVHRLAGGEDDQPVAPWKPVVEDPFQAAARRQSEARPAGLGKRLGARFVDSLVVGAVTGAVAVPFGTKALDHINDKIDAAKLSGEQVTVWLIDGTTSVYLGIILGVLFLVSALYEVLPTARWGRTLGKKLFGLEVRDIEGHEPPSFGLSLRRWLVHAVPGLLGIGLLGLLWCVWDRPWRQCWHDKAAHTFVAG